MPRRAMRIAMAPPMMPDGWADWREFAIFAKLQAHEGAVDFEYRVHQDEMGGVIVTTFEVINRD